MVGPRRRAIDPDPEANRPALRGSAQDEVKIARVKRVSDVAGRPVERGELTSDGPIPRQAPSVERQLRYSAIEAGNILPDAAGRSEVFGLPVADIGLGRTQIAFVRRGLRTFGADSRELLSRPMSTAISTSAGCPTLWS